MEREILPLELWPKIAETINALPVHNWEELAIKRQQFIKDGFDFDIGEKKLRLIISPEYIARFFDNNGRAEYTFEPWQVEWLNDWSKHKTAVIYKLKEWFFWFWEMRIKGFTTLQFARDSGIYNFGIIYTISHPIRSYYNTVVFIGFAIGNRAYGYKYAYTKKYKNV